MTRDDLRHPDAERLAEYADGTLGAEPRADVERHLADCPACRAVVMETMAFIEEPAAADLAPAAAVLPFRPRRWLTGVAAGLAVAAALVLAVFAARPEWLGGLFGGRGDRPELQELIAAVANEPTRPVEGRLSGGFKYGPPPSATRGAGDREVSPDVRIAAAKIEKAARESDSSRNLAAAGLAYLALGDFDRGVASLEEATLQEPGNAQFQNDLAAAYLARAKWTDRAEDWPRALAASERAIKASPTMVEPQFNRALALEALHLDDQAAEAWNRIREREPSSPWAAEAQQRLRALGRSVSVLNPGVTGQDSQTRREQIEDERLVAWAEALLSANSALANRLLEAAAVDADRLAETGGDTMPRDEISLIRAAASRSDAVALKTFALAHKQYGSARQAYIAEKLLQASAEMASAAATFRSVESPYQWWGPMYAAIAARMGTSAGRLAATLKEIPIERIPPSYVNLLGRYAWTEGLGLETLGEVDRARDCFLRAADLFSKGNEIENASANRNHAAEATWFLGDRLGAWRDELVALASLGRLRVSTRRNVLLLTAGFFALSQNLPEAALSFQNSLIRSIETDGRQIGAPDAYMQRARILDRLGDHRAARDDLDRAERSVAALSDPVLAGRNAATVHILRAELDQAADPRRALNDVDAAIAYFKQAGAAGRLARLLILRSHCRRAAGDLDGAAQDLEAAVQSFETDRGRLLSPQDRMQAFELERAANAELVRVELVERRNEANAFLVSERARSRVSLEGWGASAGIGPVPDNVAIICYATLSDRVAIWVLSGTSRTSIVRDVPLTRLTKDVARLRRLIAQGANLDRLRVDGRLLYDELIRPALNIVPKSAVIVFVPDGPLFGLPLGAMADEDGHPVVARHDVIVAPSVAAWFAASARLRGFAATGVTAVGDGHDSRLSGLPRVLSADAEAREIGHGYSTATVLAGREATKANVLDAPRTVLHFSGHAVANLQFPLFSRLLLAPDPRTGDNGVLFAGDVARYRFTTTGVAVLGTCEGAAGPIIDGEGALSLARMFFDAGVPSVVASLWPVDDRSHALLIGFHQELRRRHDAAGALRAAQLEMLARDGAATPVRVWGGFIALGGIHSASSKG